jgi:hypothetical protein
MGVGDWRRPRAERPPIGGSEAKVRRGLTKALYDMETFLRKQGFSEFAYDEELDVFRFPKDGSFAFCEEFADWDLLEERGYLD